jgi:hypothetical protein
MVFTPFCGQKVGFKSSLLPSPGKSVKLYLLGLEPLEGATVSFSQALESVLEFFFFFCKNEREAEEDVQ